MKLGGDEAQVGAGVRQWLPQHEESQFGMNRSALVRRFVEPPPPPTWRERLYRAWQALMGKW